MLFQNENDIKRAGIYYFYDQNGVVDDCNLYLLNGMRMNLQYLLVVVNGSLNDKGRKKLEAACDFVLVRNNTGYDVWAYKEGISHIGWDALAEYDELVMFDFTNYGPVYPFSEMFTDMNKRDVDFWGVAMRYGLAQDPHTVCKDGRIPDHIPTGLLVIRKKMLKSKDFKEYWSNMPMINSEEESMCYHEAIFTEHFKQKGYRCDCFINTDDLKDYCDHPLMFYPLKLVKNRRCPIFKREMFYNSYEEYLALTNGEPALLLYEFLRKETNYDVNMIWDNLLRTANMWDIKERMQLNYILPDNASKPAGSAKRVALMMHIYFEDQIEYCLRYARFMPKTAHIYITANSEDRKQKIQKAFKSVECEKLTVILIENRGRDVAALLVGFQPYVYDYDYICFAHDKKSTFLKPYAIGESFAYKCFENVLGTKDFINNVIAAFEDNPRLGLLAPPPPFHSAFYVTIGFEWGFNYDNTVRLAEELGIKVDIQSRKPPVAPMGTMFWFRPQALSTLFDRGYAYQDLPEEPIGDDGTMLHAVERIYPFVAQQNGYYSAWLMSTTYARLETTNYYHCFRDVNATFYRHNGIHNRKSMLTHLAKHQSVGDTNAYGGDLVTENGQFSNEQISCAPDECEATTWSLLKTLAGRLLPSWLYKFLVKARNRLLRR